MYVCRRPPGTLNINVELKVTWLGSVLEGKETPRRRESERDKGNEDGSKVEVKKRRKCQRLRSG